MLREQKQFPGDPNVRHQRWGLIGMVQSVLVLFYVCGRFGYELAGVPGAVIPIALTFGLEGYIIRRARS